MRERKFCSNGPVHMTNMAAMSIYGKNTLSLLLWNQKVNDLETWYAASGTHSSTTQFVQTMTLGWPWLIL